MAKHLDITIKAKELAKISNVFDEIGKKVNLSDISFRTSLRDTFTKVFTEDIRKRFMSSPSTTTGGMVYGGAYWRPLSDSYLLKRPDRVNGKILIDSGQLMNSFKVDSPNLISRFDNQFQFRFGTKIPYANKLQSTWKIVFFHDTLMQDLSQAYIEWLLKNFKNQSTTI